MYRVVYLFVIIYDMDFVSGQLDSSVSIPKHIEHDKIDLIASNICNFSLEFFYHVIKDQGDKSNLVISPITVWNVLAAIAEGAVSYTLKEIKYAARIPSKSFGYKEILKWLLPRTFEIKLDRLNVIFVGNDTLIERDYTEILTDIYQSQLITVNFKDSIQTATLINRYVEAVTRGNINNFVDASTISDSIMVLASALNFKGLWTHPFNSSLTAREPFYNNGVVIGEVHMMYNRHAYALAYIREIYATIIELPYGDGSFVMLILLPDENVAALEHVVLNLLNSNSNLSMKILFSKLKMAREKYTEVHCFIPRFKTESHLNLNSPLNAVGIYDLFEADSSRLNNVARTPLHVSKVIHKVKIEVTEEGVQNSTPNIAAEGNNSVRFKANRPFIYMVADKITNTLIFSGVYRKP